MQSSLEVTIDEVEKHLEDCMTQIVAAFSQSQKGKDFFSNTRN